VWDSAFGGIVFREDARGVPFSRFLLHFGGRFRYEYDFTADWKFDIRSSMAHSGFESAACDLAGHLSDSL
jgi:hypothetical protein